MCLRKSIILAIINYEFWKVLIWDKGQIFLDHYVV